MSAANTNCPSCSVLGEYGLGKLETARSEEVARHLETCSECRRWVAELPGDSFLNRLRDAQVTKGSPQNDASSSRLASTVAWQGAAAQERPQCDADAAHELAELPDYEILSKLGRGGMGVVYLARNRPLGRLEVLKVINQALLSHPGASERFQREIRAAAALRHPNVVAAYAALRAGNLLVFAMEYVLGQDLARVVKQRGPLPVAHAAYYVYQAALGLEHAHQKKMVHRDIKPNNLMLGVDGQKHIVKILDFGLAKATSEKVGERELTGSGQMLGTPDYVAPEQALDARQADIRADIYSLGCTLYFLLTHKPPFQEQNLYQTLRAHLEREPAALDRVRPDVPEELAAVALKMLAKDPASRYQTPAEVADALRGFFRPDKTLAAVAEPNVSSPCGVGAAPATQAAGATPAPQSDAGEAPAPQVGRRWRRVTGAAASLLVCCALLPGIALCLLPSRGRMAIESHSENVEHTRDGHIDENADGGDLATAPPNADHGEEIETDQGDSVPTAEDALNGLQPLHAPFSPAEAEQAQDCWARALHLKRAATNSVGMKLTLIPPGEFMMGSSQADVESLIADVTNSDWQNDIRLESPRHHVLLTQAFYLGTFEVTQGQYTEVMGKNPSWLARVGDGDLGHHPVESVSWFDAVEFCNRLSARESLPPYYSLQGQRVTVLGGDGYRLPTEAEWEYACRAGTMTPWPCGYQSTAAWQHGVLYPTGGGHTQLIGQKSPNVFGLYDMLGNVSEWCWDVHGPYSADDATNPTGQVANELRTIRGGSYQTGTDYARSAKRWPSVASGRSGEIGFRLARTCPGQAKPPDVDGAGLAPENKPVEPSPGNAALKQSGQPNGNSNSFPAPAMAPFDVRQARVHQEAWAEHLGVPIERTNSIGMKLILMPPGEFMMGSTSEQLVAAQEMSEITDWKSNKWTIDRMQAELPAHRVKLSRPFLMSATEITVGQFRRFIDASGYVTDSERLGGGDSTSKQEEDPAKKAITWQSPSVAVVDDWAVSEITWDDAVAFCNWLSEAEHKAPCYRRDSYNEWELTPNGDGYRLPTEAEWEFACRAGTTTQYSFGDDLAEFDQFGWSQHAGAVPEPRTVAMKKPNPFGLYDMHGNVEEWCHDWFNANYYAGSPLSDPHGAPISDARVIRGGHWGGGAGRLWCRSAFRRSYPPHHRFCDLGFRVVRVLTGWLAATDSR